MKISKLLKVALVGVLCVAMLLCAACTPDDNNTDNTTTAGKQNNVPSGEIPTEEGKITFYFTLGEGSAAQDSFASYFLTGGCTGWKTGNSGELEFKQLNDGNIYYCITDVTIDPSAEQGLDYQLLVGYNASSGMTDGLGIQWIDDRKSDVSAAPGGMNNPTFEWTEGQNTINLGTHVLEKKLDAPKKVNTTLVVTFKEALPEGANVALYGSMNNWGNSGFEQCICTVSADRMSASLALTDVLVANYEFKAVVYAPGVEVNSSTQWSGTAYVGDVTAENGNGQFSIGTLDADNEIEVISDIEYEVPSKLSATLRVTFSAALPEGTIVHIYGGFEGWDYAKGKCEMSSEDNTVWTINVSELSAGTLEFKVITFPAGTTEFGWTDARTEYSNKGTNFTYNVTIADNGQTIDVATITVA